MNLKSYNWPLILLVTALLSLAGCNSDSNDSTDNSTGGGSQVFDADGDGIPDNQDSCPNTVNSGEDVDADGIDDACDMFFDADGDGIPDNQDSCPNTVNSGLDADADGIDDVCDTEIAPSTDVDNDGVLNSEDNCPTVSNPGQENVDRDLHGDACDTDADGDGVDDKTDNGDGTFTDIPVPGGGDNCPLTPNSSQADQDGDEIGNACDDDIDGDSVNNNDATGNPLDNCPLVPNPGQADSDGDGVGDACEDDGDSDGIPDGSDNCPDTVNPDQEDLDGDGSGDVCDGDTDGDGIDDENALGKPRDNCPLVDNPDQADTDGDGIGDACDLANDTEYACGIGEANSPMLTSDTDIQASASKDLSGCLLNLGGLLGGLLCDVDDVGNVVDDDMGNVATMRNTDLLGLSTVTLRVAATTGFAYPGSNVVGVAFNESPQLLQVDLLGGQLIVRTLLDDAIQEESTGTGVLDLDLLGASGLLGGADTSFLVFQTEKRFDSVEVEFAPSLLSLLNEVNVHAVCAAKEGI